MSFLDALFRLIFHRLFGRRADARALEIPPPPQPAQRAPTAVTTTITETEPPPAPVPPVPDQTPDTAIQIPSRLRLHTDGVAELATGQQRREELELALDRLRAAELETDKKKGTDGGASGRAKGPSRWARREHIDATAFAPGELRRGVNELVRVSIHRPRDRARVVRAAKEADPRAAAAGSKSTFARVGSKVSVTFEAQGVTLSEPFREEVWQGQPLHFVSRACANLDIGQSCIVTAYIAVEGAIIGSIVFTRPIVAASDVARPNRLVVQAKMQRAKRVFISYSSTDRALVADIAASYRLAGVSHFFDRTGLEDGSKWEPRLFREIRRSDLFLLCWSENASVSQWVEREALYAKKRRERSWQRVPRIRVKMLEGPPWPDHPPTLNDLNFDDYERAAAVGYESGTRGGSQLQG